MFSAGTFLVCSPLGMTCITEEEKLLYLIVDNFFLFLTVGGSLVKLDGGEMLLSLFKIQKSISFSSKSITWFIGPTGGKFMASLEVYETTEEGCKEPQRKRL